MREKDERNLQITLTESGINIKPTLKAISDQVFEDFDISQDEKDNLVNSLKHVISNNLLYYSLIFNPGKSETLYFTITRLYTY